MVFCELSMCNASALHTPEKMGHSFTIIQSNKIFLLLTLSVAFCGFSSVSAIAITAFGLTSFRHVAVVFVFPAFFYILLSALIFPHVGRVVWKGFFAGLVAVALYDLSRFPFIMAGWSDFIPSIGEWLFERQGTHPLIGYTWRYVGNGGGMGIAFALLLWVFSEKNKKRIQWGCAYGMFIFSGLIITLLVSPHGQTLMFALTPLNITGSFTGHVIYGIVLGYILQKSRL